MMFGFNKTKKNKVGVIVDFDGSSIGGLLVETKEGEKIKALVSFRKSFNFLFDTNFTASLRCAKESLRFVMKELKKFHSGKIDFFVCVFSSPWFISQTKKITVTMENPFEVKNDFFKNLIEEEEKSFNKNEKTNSQFIEHEVMKSELNGYSVNNPIGKIASSVKSSVYISAGVKKTMEMAKEEIEKTVGNVPLSFATFPLVAFKVLSDIIHEKGGFLIIDIGGEITEIIVVRNGSLERAVSFSVGYNLLFRRISSKMNTFFEESPSVLRAYLREHLATDDLDKIATAVNDSVKEWRDGLKRSLFEISAETLLPQNIFLTRDDLVCKPFYSCINGEDFLELTSIKKPFIVKKIEHSQLSQYFNTANSFQYENSSILAMEAIYASLFLKIKN